MDVFLPSFWIGFVERLERRRGEMLGVYVVFFSAYFFFLLGCGYLVGCWQCQKSPAGKPCEIKFECGKTSDVTAAQDTLFHILQGICQYAYKLRKYDVLVPRVAEEYVPEAINATGTNVNFDLGRITEYIQRGLFIREMLIATYWV